MLQCTEVWVVSRYKLCLTTTESFLVGLGIVDRLIQVSLERNRMHEIICKRVRMGCVTAHYVQRFLEFWRRQSTA